MDNRTDEVVLTVPVSKQRRSELIESACEVVRSLAVNSPVTYDFLTRMGERAVIGANGNPDELAFAMLMCSNELWRPFFEATPYNRRLLLMPQCLKSSRSCQAIIDDLGLICAGCNQCPINPFLEEAEALGYATLIAEGTSSALALVEEGQVDAILGVSCMDTLQKSFDKVVSSAIPSIAIPLLNDGCSDTEVDQSWLLSTLKAGHGNIDMAPLSVSILKNQTETLFKRDILLAEFAQKAHPSITQELAVNSMLQGGKRMRPLLALIAYSAYSANYDQQIAGQIMLAVECMHKASLIHDDIEDQDDYRYNQKTAHHENGNPQAINLGDYLIGQGYRILSQLGVDPNIKLDLFNLFTAMHIESTLGQGEELAWVQRNEIPSVEKTLKFFKQKTGSAITVSLLSGAIAAEAPLLEQETLRTFSELFGIAYQIRDDLTEFRGLATDQTTASFPFLKSLLAEKTGIRASNEDDWKDFIVKHHIDHAAQNELDKTISQLYASLDQLQSHKLRLALLNLMNPIFKRL